MFFFNFNYRRLVFSYTEKYYCSEEEIEENTGLLPGLNGKVLVLNQSYEPVSICSAKKAIILLYLTKAELIAKRDGKIVRSVKEVYPHPSVIRLPKFLKMPFKKIELSRKNILKRDGFRCQYCGHKGTDLTIDHVIPKSRGGTDNWENLVAACHKCNNRKGNRTPEEANMSLLNKPRKPHHILFIKQYMGKIEENWKPFLFME